MRRRIKNIWQALAAWWDEPSDLEEAVKVLRAENGRLHREVVRLQQENTQARIIDAVRRATMERERKARSS